MIRLKKSLPVLLLCVAVLSFSFLAIGGEFLHSHIHDHEHGTEQECPFFQFLIQALITLVVFLAAIKVKSQYHCLYSFEPFIKRIQYSLPALRAPPIV